MNIWRLLIFVLPLAIACSDCTKSNEQLSSPTGSDEYDVLSALLDTEYLHITTQDDHCAVLIAHSRDWARCISDDSVYTLGYIAAVLPQVSEDLALNLLKTARLEHPWQDSFKTKVRHVIVGDKSINSDTRICGTLTLSRVGFNSDHTQALVDAYFHCGMTCGKGYLSYFRKKCGRWVLIKQYVCSRS